VTAGMTIAALQRFLDAVAPEAAATVTAVTPLTGGYSRDTAIGEVVWADGRRQRLVLRGDPPSDRGVFVSDRDEEWRILSALAATDPGTAVVRRIRGLLRLQVHHQRLLRRPVDAAAGP
jgi:aminoglycoside phosphotransferase (APT) family kinase protein